MKKLERVLHAKRESKHVDFKEAFDPNSKADWCEIIKDIVAMANSGGGSIVIGLKNNGTLADVDVSALLEVDQAILADKIHSYTGTHFSELEVIELKKEGHTIAAIEVGSVDLPMIFTNPGTYPVTPKEQKTAFAKGTIYFRHGAKSEPGSSEDLSSVIERRLREIRREWLDGVRKVVKAPPGSSIGILSPEGSQEGSDKPVAIQIVDDLSAPAFHLVDPNKTHPYRQTEVVKEINKRLKGTATINAYDVFAVRRLHGIDTKVKFRYKPAFGSPQYSPEFVDWLEANYNKDADFFRKAREFMSQQQKKTV